MSQVTVIVPVYNMSQYIDKCVDSVLKQTYRDFTLVIIDDGSMDDSLEKCIGWRRNDDRIIVMSKTNAGLGPTRNLGVRMSSSEYVTFLDADDWWHYDYLALMMRGTEYGRNDIVLCDVNYVVEKMPGVYEYNKSALRLSEGSIELSDEWNLINRARTFMCGKLYRRKLFIDYQVEQPAHAYEDVATTPYLIARADSIYHVPHGLYFYLRNRQGSIVNNFSSLNGLLTSLEELHERFRAGGLLDKYYPSLRQLFWGQLVFIYQILKKRFPNESAKNKEKIKCDAKRIVCKCFPELEAMFHYTFGVPVNDQVIVDALKKIVINEELILQRGIPPKTDYVINPKEGASGGKEITIALPNEKILDEEWVTWDIADEIFHSVFL